LNLAGVESKPPRLAHAVDDKHMRTGNLAGVIATGLAVIYAIPHIWWGLGIGWPAPADLDSDQGLGSHPAITFVAFYGMGALALFSAVLTQAMMPRFRDVRFPAWFLGLHGWGIGVLLLIRGGIGLAESTLILSGVRECPFAGCRSGTQGRDSIGMTGLFWEPLFVLWGMALVMTTLSWMRAKRSFDFRTLENRPGSVPLDNSPVERGSG